MTGGTAVSCPKDCDQNAARPWVRDFTRGAKQVFGLFQRTIWEQPNVLAPVISVCSRSHLGFGCRREQMTMMHRHSDDHSSKLFVFFQEDDNVGVKPIRK